MAAHTDVTKPQVEPVVWTPPPDPGLTGPYLRNDALADSELWPVPDRGPEGIVLDTNGALYTGTQDGSILRITQDGDRIDRIAQTGGRPLGVELFDDGHLLVCDADEGLLAVDVDDGSIEPLVTAFEGEPLTCTNNAAIAADGTVWFTDSSRKFPVHHYKGDIIEHTGTGRLFRRDPDGTVTVAMDGLHFANGVTLDPDERFVLVAETGMYRILRLWLTGDQQGRVEPFAEMPGFPDNLSTGPTGTFWCAVASPRNTLLDQLAPRPPALRKAAWSLPDALQPGPAKTAIVFGYDGDGTVTHNLQWHGGEFIVATGAREHDGWLYVGSLESTAVLRHQL